MFKRTHSILDDAAGMKELDADLIMTAAVVGFASNRLATGTVRFDSDSATDPRIPNAVARINKALTGDYGHGKAVTGGVTPDYKKGSTDFISTTNPEIETLVGQELRRIATGDTSVGYQGRGAYTGFVTDSTGSRASVKATTRFNVPLTGHGDRWIPSTYTYAQYNQDPLKVKWFGADQSSAPWGLIAGKETLGDNMVQKPSLGGGTLVGYTHGMIQAIYDCRAHGGTCAPFEIAVGEHTTKLASCFPCTLFMTATGYAPSSIHLGRGESWVPFYDVASGTAGYGDVDVAIAKANTEWRAACASHLTLGAGILAAKGVNETHRARLQVLRSYLTSHKDDAYAAANLILDAITVHDGEAERVIRTLPA